MHHIRMNLRTHTRARECANTLATGNWVPFHNCCWYSILSTNSWPAFSIAILSVAYSTTFHSPSSLSLSLVLLSFYLPLYLCLVVLRIVNYCYAVSFCLRFDPIWIFFCYYVCCSLFFSFSLCYSWWHDISCFFMPFFVSIRPFIGLLCWAIFGYLACVTSAQTKCCWLDLFFSAHKHYTHIIQFRQAYKLLSQPTQRT